MERVLKGIHFNFKISCYMLCFNSLPSLCFFLQTRQPVFVQLLQGVFRVYHCNWLNPVQKASVEACIKVLSDVGKIHQPPLLWSKDHCGTWLKAFNRNIYILTLCPAKSRAIAIPVDLDSQVNNLFVKSNNVVQKSILSWRLSAKNTSRRDSGLTSSKDYRNIIERLQVGGRTYFIVFLQFQYNSCNSFHLF